MKKKKKNNIAAKILVWVMLIAMIGSVIGSIFIYLFY